MIQYTTQSEPTDTKSNIAVADLFFEFLRNLLYAPEKATLDVDSLPPEFQKLGAGLLFLAQCTNEQRALSTALSKGDLSSLPPSVENTLAAPTKALQAALLHLTWQTQQVAKGDYGQKLDFMGEFSDAFNAMVLQLKERQEALVSEKEVIAQKNRELERTHALFINLTLNAPEWIIALDEKTGDIRFLNKSAEQIHDINPSLLNQIRQSLLACPRSVVNRPVSWEIKLISEIRTNPAETHPLPKTLYYSVNSHYVPWADSHAIAHVLTDTTKAKEAEFEMQRLAFQDSLTNLYNRRYGMDLMHELMRDRIPFSVAFVDIDYLKYCNDVYGHEAGNQYILQVSELLGRLPGNKVICRIGGDEFMVIQQKLPISEMENNLSILREELIDYHAPNYLDYHRSFSFGCCEVPAGSIRPLSEVLSDADHKMYQFKFAYKNKLKEAGGQQLEREQ